MLRSSSARDILGAAGIPVSMFTDSDGTGQREAYRRFMHLTIAPVALVVAEKLARKLDEPEMSLSFDRLFAADLSGRARVFQSLVGGGMGIAKAASLAGLMESE